MKEQEINRIMEVLKVFRDASPDMSVNTVLAFLEVAKNRGVSARELEHSLDFKQATASRMLRYFDRLQAPGKPGLDFFYTEIDSTNLKSRLRYLNENGKTFLGKVERAYKGQ